MSANPTPGLKTESARSSAFGTNLLQDSELQLRDVVLILRRRKLAVLLGMVLGLSLGLLYVAIAHKKYTSSVIIEVNKESGATLGLDDLTGLAGGLGGGEELNTDLMTQKSIIESDSTLLTVADRLKLYGTPPYSIPASEKGKGTPLGHEIGLPIDKAQFERARLLGIMGRNLKVTLVKNTRLLKVDYTDTDPVRAAQIANTIVDGYIDLYTQSRFQASTKASAWLQSQLADLKAKVGQSQKAVEDYQQETGLTGIALPLSLGGREGSAAQPVSSDNAPLERLIALNEDLTNAEVARISREAIYRLAETQDPDVVIGIGSSTLVSGIGAGSPLSPGSQDLTLLGDLRQQQGKLKVQLAADTTKYGSKNPAITQIHNQITALDEQIHDELGRIRLRTKNDLDLAKLAEDGIRQRVQAQEQEVNKTSTKADQLLLLQEEALSDRSLYDGLYTKLEEANVAAGIHASNITLIDPARVSALASSPNPVRDCTLLALVGLFFGLASAFLQNYFDDSIVTPDDLQAITSSNAIGVIPDFMQSGGRSYGYGGAKAKEPAPARTAQSWLIQAPRSQVAEAYRTFRTAILLSRPEHPPKTILITSGSPGEGKSTTAFNTATAFAVQGKRVLLIDADLRRGNVHIEAGMRKDIGLSTCLTSSAPPAENIVQSADCDTLFQMPAGPTPPNPAELIGSKRFTELISELNSNFDFVFIDSPPVLLLTDAQLISTQADAYIVVVRCNRTTKRQLRRVMHLMREPNPRSLGILLNAADTSSAAYAEYGYYKGSNSYYGSDNA